LTGLGPQWVITPWDSIIEKVGLRDENGEWRKRAIRNFSIYTVHPIYSR
jgi:hypothetical protein